MIAALDHVQIAIPYGGEDKCRDYYGTLLGLVEIPKPANMQKRGGCWFILGDKQLHIGVDPDFRAAGKAHIAMASDELDQLQQTLRRAGYLIKPDNDLDGRRRFFSADPFGNRLEFIQRGAGS